MTIEYMDLRQAISDGKYPILDKTTRHYHDLLSSATLIGMEVLLRYRPDVQHSDGKFRAITVVEYLLVEPWVYELYNYDDWGSVAVSSHVGDDWRYVETVML
jgi:hypothetical protein